jgi:hypothetical protein
MTKKIPRTISNLPKSVISLNFSPIQIRNESRKYGSPHSLVDAEPVYISKRNNFWRRAQPAGRATDLGIFALQST